MRGQGAGGAGSGRARRGTDGERHRQGVFGRGAKDGAGERRLFTRVRQGLLRRGRERAPAVSHAAARGGKRPAAGERTGRGLGFRTGLSFRRGFGFCTGLSFRRGLGFCTGLSFRRGLGFCFGFRFRRGLHFRFGRGRFCICVGRRKFCICNGRGVALRCGRSGHRRGYTFFDRRK